MICIGIPVYNSSSTIENPLFKINIILEELKNSLGELPYIVFIDDCSSEEETTKMLKIVMGMVSPEYHKRVLFLKNNKNIGVFSSLNKIIKIITLEDIIKPVSEIKAVMFRDHDDYITSANIEAAVKIVKEDLLGVPAIKIDIKNSDIEDFKIMSRSAESLEQMKKRETLFIKRFDVESLMYFGLGATKSYFNSEYKAICTKDTPNFYKEYYDLFNTYALSIYSTKLLKMLGGFDLYSMDSAGTKACDICALRVLNLMLKNILRKTEEYFITTEKIKQFSNDILELEKIEESLRFSNLLFKPTIFRVVADDSLSHTNIEKREFYYFTKLKTAIHYKKDMYHELRNLKNSFMFLKSGEVSEIIEYYLRMTKHIIQNLYTPIVENVDGAKMIYKGEDWVINNKEVQC